LDVDTLIRSLTANRRSLDDFERLFLGKGGDTGPMILPYGLDEVVQDLNEVAPYDWTGFFRDRVAKVQTHADLDGIVRGGYTLVYSDHPSVAEQMLSDPESSLYTGEDYWYSLGLRVGDDGTLMDVRWGSPADKAKLAPKQKLLTVNGTPYSAALLHGAIKAATYDRKPLQLTLRQDGETISAELDYHDGERYPDLKRSLVGSAYLEMITRPRSQ
jgi:predicted metalloprotease with PDZ domain